MQEFNRGITKEREAGEYFNTIFDDVTKTKNGEFYDYLVSFGTTKLLVEVKWVECRYKTANIYLRWRQAMKLVLAKDFLLYITTSKGNFFITPEQVYDTAHVHSKPGNPKDYTIALNAVWDGKSFSVSGAHRCLNCEGKLSDSPFHDIKWWQDNDRDFLRIKNKTF